MVTEQSQKIPGKTTGVEEEKEPGIKSTPI